jgi:hypothetical protein
MSLFACPFCLIIDIFVRLLAIVLGNIRRADFEVGCVTYPASESLYYAGSAARVYDRDHGHGMPGAYLTVLAYLTTASLTAVHEYARGVGSPG